MTHPELTESLMSNVTVFLFILGQHGSIFHTEQRDGLAEVWTGEAQVV